MYRLNRMFLTFTTLLLKVRECLFLRQVENKRVYGDADILISQQSQLTIVAAVFLPRSSFRRIIRVNLAGKIRHHY